MIIPLIILSFTSIQLIRALHAARLMRASMSKEDDATQVAMANAEKSLSKCFLAIILLLLIAVVLDFLVNIGIVLQFTGLERCIFRYLFYVLSEMFMAINNSSNIILYTIFKAKLRRIIFNLLLCRKSIDEVSSNMSNTSNFSLNTRATGTHSGEDA